jgi:cardiolipin synthase (CMP-forming)
MSLTYKGEKILNVPNAISFYRLIMFPVILTLALLGYELLFVILFCINLISDLFDGLIARIFNQVTRFGAQLDYLADTGSYILALYGVFTFRWVEIQPHAWFLYIFIAILIISYIVSLIRFGKIPGLHIFSVVSSGYVQGTFFLVLFAWKFIPWFYYIAIGWGILAYIEKTIILLIIDDIKRGIKGLYWLRKKETEHKS